MSTLITNIGELVINDPAGSFSFLTGAALIIDGGRIAWTGPAGRAPAADEIVDARGRAVLPGFVDSHAHLVFAGERGAEFAAGWRASHTRRAASRHGRGDPGRVRRHAPGRPAPPSGRDGPAGHDHV